MSESIIAVLSKAKMSGKYKSMGKYKFPSYEEVDPREKDLPEYSANVVKAAYSALMRDRTSMPTDYYNYIQVLRDYGSGNQSQTYYSNRLKEAEPGTSTNQSGESTLNSSYSLESKRKGDDNIQHKILSVMTALKSSVHGMLDEFEEDIYINSIDNESGAEEERLMYEALFDTQMSQFTKTMQETYNLPIYQDTGMPVDISIEELQTYKETGGFKTAWAESMEEAIRFTEEYSNWNDVLKRKFIDDFVDINFCSGRVVHDLSTGLDRWEYVDPANFVIQYSQDRTFDDAEYAGYFTLEKIGTLAEKGFNTQDLISAAENYENLWNNPTDVDWGSVKSSISLTDKIFEFKIPVFHFQWIDVNVKRMLKFKNKFGKNAIYDIDFNDKEIKPLSDYKKRKGIDQEELRTRIKKAYQCSWVVDTEMVYDFGPVPNQGRKSKTEAKLSYVAWRGLTTNRKMIFGSITESVIPLLDHLQIAWLKYQDAMVKAHPGGYAVNLRLLQNLKVGGKLIDPLEAYKMYYKTGVLPYMDTPMGENYKGGSVIPLTRIEGTQGELMNVIQTEIAFVIQMIERITGIAPASMGVAPDANQPVANTQMALQGTNNILKPGINGVFDIKEGLAYETSRRIPILCRNVKSSAESLSRIIGPKSVEILKEAERNGAEYGLYMEARPDGQDKQDLITMLQEAMKRGRDGEASVNIGQAMYIIERIKSGGNFKKLQRQVDIMIRKSEEMAFEKKRILIAEQNQQQAQMEKAKNQTKMQEKQLDTQSEIAIDNNKSKNKIMEIQVEKNIEIKQALMKQRMELITAHQKQEFEKEKLLADRMAKSPVL